MLARVRLQLNSDTIKYYKGSALQGVLFEKIEPDYAGWLHQQSMHPYSQYIHMSGGSSEWVINTLTDEAYEKIIKPLLEPSFDSFVIRQGNIKTKIVSKTLETTDTKELMREFREDQSESNFRIKAVTPVAFRQDGAFNILPLPQLVYQSLMNRYSLLADEISMSDEDILEELASMTLISGYKLRTMRFPLEGNTIPGFVGSFSYYIRKSQTMARYVRMLLRFGEYSGIGVKTGMGMGSIRLIERGEDNAGTGD